jgi:hypothetical protein
VSADQAGKNPNWWTDGNDAVGVQFASARVTAAALSPVPVICPGYDQDIQEAYDFCSISRPRSCTPTPAVQAEEQPRAIAWSTAARFASGGRPGEQIGLVHLLLRVRARLEAEGKL